MITQRFNTPSTWRHSQFGNLSFLGFIKLLDVLSNSLSPSSKMIEIGSYMGEATLMFASTGLFSQIYVIDPFTSDEKFNTYLKETKMLQDYNEMQLSVYVEKEFENNTRYFDNIRLLKEFSYNTHNSFVDRTIDFIYIDGEHTYDAVKTDIETYRPKLKKGGIIGGHDYDFKHWPGVCNAVNDVFGEPDYIFDDTSWIKFL